MSYQRTTWVNGETPINADNLNNIEEGIVANEAAIAANEAAIQQIDEEIGGIADYIVEQGTSGDWKYRKWNSGIAECFGYISLGDSVLVSAVGNVYRGNVSVSLPPIFNDIPSNVQITMGSPLSSTIAIQGRALDKDNLSLYIWKATSGATSEANAAIHAIGTWK